MRKTINGHTYNTEKSRLIIKDELSGQEHKIYITKSGKIFETFGKEIFVAKPKLEKMNLNMLNFMYPDFEKLITPLKNISFLLPEYYYNIIKAMPNSSEILRNIIIDYLKGIEK